MIERLSVESDARLKKIVLTDAAIEIHKRITEEIAEREKRLRIGIDEADLDVFFEVINRLSFNMEEHDD